MEKFAVTGTEAQALIDWMGNNGIDSDVDLYDGGVNDYTGETFFGFSTDVVPTHAQIEDALNRAVQIVAFQNPSLASDSFVKRIVNEPDTMREVLRHTEIVDGYASVRVVFWNVALV